VTEIERETSLTSNLSPYLKEKRKHVWQRERETSLTSNLSPYLKEKRKHA